MALMIGGLMAVGFSSFGTVPNKEEYKEKFTSPFSAAARGYIDDIVRPQNARWQLCCALKMLQNKKVERPWRKHDNLPL